MQISKVILLKQFEICWLMQSIFRYLNCLKKNSLRRALCCTPRFVHFWGMHLKIWKVRTFLFRLWVFTFAAPLDAAVDSNSWIILSWGTQFYNSDKFFVSSTKGTLLFLVRNFRRPEIRSIFLSVLWIQLPVLRCAERYAPHCSSNMCQYVIFCKKE